MSLVFIFLRLSILLAGSLASISCSTIDQNMHLEKGKYDQFRKHMQNFVEREFAKDKEVGLSIAVVAGQELVWARGFGYANREKKIKAEPNTRYRAGSITKLFTAMAAMQLNEQARMDIHKPLVSHLPEFNMQSRFGNTNTITPANIMSHHSGLPTDYLDGMWSKSVSDYRSLVTELNDEYVAYPANTLYVYSNIGYALLGHAVENVVKQDYVDFLHGSILKPLGMNNSDISPTLAGENASLGYSKGKLTPELPLRDVPAGGLNTTVTDMSHFIKMINNDGKFKSSQVLSHDSLHEMMTAQNLDVYLDFSLRIGFGWHYYDGILDKSINVLGHSGGTETHSSELIIAPDLQLGVIIMTNDESKRESVRKIAEEAMRMGYSAKTGKASPMAGEHSPVKVTDPQDFSGAYMTANLGAAFIKKDGNSFSCYTETYDTNLKLKRKENGAFRFSKHLIGFIPIALDGLEEIDFRTDKIGGHELIVGNFKGVDFLEGQKLEPRDIPPGWLDRLGEYILTNQLEPKILQIKKLKLSKKKGFLLMTLIMNSGENTTYIIKPIDDNNSVVGGLGRSLGVNIRASKQHDE